jgi:DNA-binding transcriptional ArsR family regulator
MFDINNNSKKKILKVIETVYPGDLSIKEVAEKTKLSRPTTSTWLKVLHAEGKIEISRRIGRAVFYRLRVRKVDTAVH